MQLARTRKQYYKLAATPARLDRGFANLAELVTPGTYCVLKWAVSSRHWRPKGGKKMLSKTCRYNKVFFFHHSCNAFFYHFFILFVSSRKVEMTREQPFCDRVSGGTALAGHWWGKKGRGGGLKVGDWLAGKFGHPEAKAVVINERWVCWQRNSRVQFPKRESVQNRSLKTISLHSWGNNGETGR